MRLLSLLLFIAAIASVTQAAELSCDVAKMLSSPTLKNNDKFWDQIGELSSKGNYNEEQIRKLLAEHGHTISPSKPLAGLVKEGTTHIQPGKSTYTMHQKAAKDVNNLPGGLRAKFNQFLENIGPKENPMEVFRSQPGKWGLEKLGTSFGKNAYSVRLNHGYRVTFDLESDGSLLIRDVTKTFTHNN